MSENELYYFLAEKRSSKDSQTEYKANEGQERERQKASWGPEEGYSTQPEKFFSELMEDAEL